MANFSWSSVAARVLDQGTCENSAFRGYLAKGVADGSPEVETNGIVAVTLQKMLVQTDGPRILVFPAFPRGVDVDVKVHVPRYGQAHPAAELRVVARAGSVEVFVAPESRRQDVVLLHAHVPIKADDLGAGTSRLAAALGPQGFSVAISDGGAAVVTGADGAHLTTVSSTFSEPGPRFNNFSEHTAGTKGWRVEVDRSRASSGLWTVHATAQNYSVARTYQLDPPTAPRRLLVNDSITTTTNEMSALRSAAVGIAVSHRATVAATPAEVETAIVPGAFDGGQCGSDGNYGDQCASPCPDPDVYSQNNGRPDSECSSDAPLPSPRH